MAKAKQAGSLVKVSGKFYLQMMVEGKRYQKVIKDDLGKTVTEKSEAEKWRATIADTIRLKHAGILSDRLALADIEATYLEHLPTYSKRGTLHVDATNKTRVAPSTLALNLHYLSTFLAWLRENRSRVTALQDITKAHVSAFMASRGQTLRASTYNRLLMALRHIFSVIPYGDNYFLEVVPRSSSEVSKATRGHRAFTPAELLTMQERATGWMRPAMLIGYHAGLRIGDVATLRWEEIDMVDGFITKVQRKTGKVETVYCPEAMPELKAWRSSSEPVGEYVFPEQANLYLGIVRKCDRTRPGRLFTQFLVKTCGFNVRDDAGNTVLGFHSLRTSNATYSRRAGEGMDAIQRRLAHTSQDTTNGYLDLNQDDIKRELKRSHVPLALPGTIAHVEDALRELRENVSALAWTADENALRAAMASLQGTVG